MRRTRERVGRRAAAAGKTRRRRRGTMFADHYCSRLDQELADERRAAAERAKQDEIERLRSEGAAWERKRRMTGAADPRPGTRTTAQQNA